jgi:hypothetical protein
MLTKNVHNTTFKPLAPQQMYVPVWDPSNDLVLTAINKTVDVEEATPLLPTNTLCLPVRLVVGKI